MKPPWTNHTHAVGGLAQSATPCPSPCPCAAGPSPARLLMAQSWPGTWDQNHSTSHAVSRMSSSLAQLPAALVVVVITTHLQAPHALAKNRGNKLPAHLCKSGPSGASSPEAHRSATTCEARVSVACAVKSDTFSSSCRRAAVFRTCQCPLFWHPFSTLLSPVLYRVHAHFPPSFASSIAAQWLCTPATVGRFVWSCSWCRYSS